MGVDSEDPRELEARRQIMRDGFEQAWNDRLNILLEPQGEQGEELPLEQQHQLAKYLSIIDKDFIEEVGGNFSEFNTVLALAMIHQGQTAAPDRDPKTKTSRLFSVHGPSFNPSLGGLWQEPAVIKDIVSELRAYAVAASQQGQGSELLRKMERDLADIMMRQYAIYDLSVPDRLKFLTDTEERKRSEIAFPKLHRVANIEKEQQLADKIAVKSAEYIRQGIDPRMADRIASQNFRQEFEHRLAKESSRHHEHAEKMMEFGEKYAEPHKFLEKIFELHDGELPI